MFFPRSIDLPRFMLRNRPKSPTGIGLFLIYNPYRIELYKSAVLETLEQFMDLFCIVRFSIVNNWKVN